MKDTYNLLADGIVKLLRVAAVANIAVGEWAEAHYERYFGSSIKGEATIDWSDRKARRKPVARGPAAGTGATGVIASGQRQSIVAGAELLGQLLRIQRKRC